MSFVGSAAQDDCGNRNEVLVAPKAQEPQGSSWDVSQARGGVTREGDGSQSHKVLCEDHFLEIAEVLRGQKLGNNLNQK